MREVVDSAIWVASCAAAGLVLSLAYVGPFWPEVALVAPAAFLFVAARRPTVRAALCGAAFGAAFGCVGLAWIACVTWLGYFALVAFIAGSFAAVGASCAAGVALGLPLWLSVPPVLVAFELLRARLFTGFPWLLWGHALSDRLSLIQCADLAGAYTVSYVVAVWCSALADAAFRFARNPRQDLVAALRPLIGALSVLIAAAAYGAVGLASVRTADGPRLFLIQGNIDTPRASRSREAAAEVDAEIWRIHEELSRTVPPEAELIVWSESMLPSYYNDPLDGDARIWRTRLKELLGELGRPLLTGSNATGPHPGVPPRGPRKNSRRLDYNSAFLIAPDGSIEGRYDKMRLVPFGEYVPLASWPILSGLTPYAADDPGYAHGDPEQPLLEFSGYHFGVLICYEDVFPELARRAARMGAEFLVNLSSEAWFAGTAEIPQHLRIARFRAVETRMPLVRCCNVGVSSVIDPAGRVVKKLPGSDSPGGARGTLLASVPLAEGKHFSLYTTLGDLAPLALVTVHVAAAGALIFKKRRGC